MNAPQSAVAISGFNLASQPIGFLQPLFSGGFGDNQTYVQRLQGFAHVADFEAVAWPEQGTIRFMEQLEARVGGESIWAFRFPGDSPLVLHWAAFRSAMSERINHPALVARPLLRFDIVQTLNIVESKSSVFTEAFEMYSNIDKVTAERWRNRSILEPALIEVAHKFDVEGGERPYSLKIRQDGDVFLIAIDGKLEPALTSNIEAAFQETIERYPHIFSGASRLRLLPTQKAEPHEAPKRRQGAGVTIILAGKLAGSQLRLPLDHEQSIDIINAEYIDRHFHSIQPSPLTLVVGMQTQWRQLVATAGQVREANPLIVAITSSASALLRDYELQTASLFPSISIFAPASLGPNSDPSSVVSPVVDILTDEGEDRPPKFDPHRLPARHNVLLREPIKNRPDEQGVACRLGARALRAGVLPGARADLFIDPDLTWPTEESWSRVFEPLYAVRLQEPGTIPQRPKPRHAMLLAERQDEPFGKWNQGMREGAQRLLQMRGWSAEDRGTYLEVSEENRRFSAVVVTQGNETPTEEGDLRQPAFGRAPLLVIHSSPRRETLLVGNRGQYCHVSLSDIALMQPGTTWIWQVIKRQLLVPARNPTLAALRLTTAVAAEAIRMNRIEVISQPPSMERLIHSLEADDCERFFDFLPDGITRREALLRFRVRFEDDPADSTQEAILRIGIEADGPTLVVD